MEKRRQRNNLTETSKLCIDVVRIVRYAYRVISRYHLGKEVPKSYEDPTLRV